MGDHIFKLMWAVWSPGISSGRIDPQHFEEARQFAASTHNRRMAGLYVNHDEDGGAVPPRDAVGINHATSLLQLAKARLALEEASDFEMELDGNDDLEWFLTTVSDVPGQRRLFSEPFLEKHAELNGRTREWARWARKEFSRIAAEESAHLQRELARATDGPGAGKAKWIIKVRLRTASHSLRQKALNFWNEQIPTAKLTIASKKGNELLLEMTLNDNVKIDQLFDAGMAWSKLYIAALNIGTGGLFWYEFSGQAETYYESIHDLGSPGFQLQIGKRRGLSAEWALDDHRGEYQRRIVVDEAQLNNAINCLAAFSNLPEKHAEAIFGEYLKGLTLLSKTDLHLGVEREARLSFMNTLRRAMLYFGDLEQDCADLTHALHQALQQVLPEEGHRNKLLDALTRVPVEVITLGDVVWVKRIVDIYLVVVAKRLCEAR